jgi:hypothetical protein
MLARDWFAYDIMMPVGASICLSGKPSGHSNPQSEIMVTEKGTLQSKK